MNLYLVLYHSLLGTELVDAGALVAVQNKYQVLLEPTSTPDIFAYLHLYLKLYLYLNLYL